MKRSGGNEADHGWGTGTGLRQALARLTRVAELTLARAEPGEGVDALCRLTADSTGASRILALVGEAGREPLLCVGSRGLEECDDRPGLLAWSRRLGEWVGETKTAVEVLRPAEDPRFREGAPAEAHRARALPLRAYGRVLGALVLVWTDEAEEDVPRGWLDLLAHHLELSVLNWELHREARSARERLQESEGMRLRAERTAAAAELAAEMAGELVASMESLKDLMIRTSSDMAPGDPHRTALELMFQQTSTLERLLEQQIELTRRRGPRFDPVDLNELVEDAIRAIDPLVEGKRLRITRRLAFSLPELLLDPRTVREVLTNALRAAATRAPVGGRLKLESKRRGEVLEFSISADGDREPGRALEELWSPFLVGEEGRGFSMETVRQILERHRGSLDVASDRDWPVILRLRLPIPGNRDRRRAPGERRSGRDRRAA